MMNPLSPLTYYARHKGKTLLLVAIIALATLGLFLMVAILDAIPLRANAHYLNYVSRVYPKTGDQLEPGVLSQLQLHPDVERVVPETGLTIAYPVMIGVESLRLLGVSPEDASYLMEYAGLRLKAGQLFETRTNGVVLTEEVARALNLQIGDQLGRSIDRELYFSLVTDLTLVGIVERDLDVTSDDDFTPRFGFISGAYLDSHELYAPRLHNLVVIPKTGHLETVNDFLFETIKTDITGVETVDEMMGFVRMARQSLYFIFGFVNVLVSIVIALVVATINRIALMERIEELGALNALGFDFRFLTWRIISETAVVSGLGWFLGMGLSLVVLALLRDTVFYNQGTDINLWNLVPFIFIIPMPFAVVFSAMASIRKVFANFDAVQILERGKLIAESQASQQSTARSTSKPLSALTFYNRHRRRSIRLVITMALMILGVALPAFLLLTSINAMKPEAESLRHFSMVSPVQGSDVDAGVAAQIRNYPGVEKTISTIMLGIQMNVPPGGETTVHLYGLSNGELPFVVDRLGLFLIEGQMPRPRSNDLVISAAVAKNRGLAVGDVVGGASSDGAEFGSFDSIPAEMVITGILGPDIPWIGFVSFEFLQSHELTQDRPQRLLVFPTPGTEKDVNAWLEQTLVNTFSSVDTYEATVQEYEEVTMMMAILFMLVESIIAVVAAVALATLNYIFFSQRKDEFGILNALGRSRRWLTMRTMRETGSTVFLAWLIGAGICLLGLILVQRMIYAPMGLNAEIGNLMPWLFTVPIPLAVVLVSTGTIARMLHKLDPVAIVERR